MRILDAEAGEEFFYDVRFAVAVGVFGVKQIGRGGDEDALSPDGDAERLGDFVEKDGAGFERAVAVAVFEEADASDGRALFAVLAAVVARLGDPNFAVGTEVDRYGALDERLDGHELDTHAGPHLNRGERVGRRLREVSLRALLFVVRFEVVV